MKIIILGLGFTDWRVQKKDVLHWFTQIVSHLIFKNIFKLFKYFFNKRLRCSLSKPSVKMYSEFGLSKNYRVMVTSPVKTSISPSLNNTAAIQTNTAGCAKRFSMVPFHPLDKSPGWKLVVSCTMSPHRSKIWKYLISATSFPPKITTILFSLPEG